LIPLPAGEEAADCFTGAEGVSVLTIRETSARVWNAAGRPVTPILEHAEFVQSAEFSPDGRRVVTISGLHTARVWGAVTGAALTPPLEQKEVIFRATLSPDGRHLIVTGVTGRYFPTRTLTVWDIDAARAVALPEVMREGDVVFGPGGDRLLTVRPDAVQAWSLTTGQALGPPLKIGPVKRVAFSPDGQRLTVWGDLTRALQVWDLATGTRVGSDVPAGGELRAASFSPDGSKLLTVTQTEVRIWAVETGRRLAPPLVLPPDGWQAEFSSDGRRILTHNGNGRYVWPRARFWDAGTGQPLTPLLTFGENAPRNAPGRVGKRFAASADGSRLIAVSDGKVLDRSFRSTDSPDDARVRAQILSGRRINEAGTPVFLLSEEFRRLWEAYSKSGR
jgi:WD40 repeat protein